MPDTSEKTEAEKPANKAAAAKAAAADKSAAKAAAPDDDESAELERPKMPTGKFVTATPLQIWDPTLKKGTGGRRILDIGERLPEGMFTPKQLKRMQDAGTITHEFA